MSDNHYHFALEVDFDPQKLVESATAFVLVARLSRHPVHFSVAGYDDDPRDLWHIPEVVEYLRKWVRLVQAKGGHGLDRLDDFSKALLLFAVSKAKLERTPTGEQFVVFGEL